MKRWKAIKRSIQNSPLSKRNKNRRDKQSISIIKTKEKLIKTEKLVNLLEEILIFNENDKNDFFWKSKILKHRQIIRLYSDAMFAQILRENDKMRIKISNLIMRIKSMENENKNKNENSNNLMGIEARYYQLLQTQKQQQNAMKKCEMLIKRKDDEIHRLKAQLIRMSHDTNMLSSSRSLNALDVPSDDGRARGGSLNDGLLRLKGEIAEKKLHVTRQLNLLTINMHEDSDKVLNVTK